MLKFKVTMLLMATFGLIGVALAYTFSPSISVTGLLFYGGIVSLIGLVPGVFIDGARD